MNNDFNNIIAQLDTLISALMNGGNPLVREVYVRAPDEITVYPCVIILPMGTVDNYLNLRDARRIYQIKLLVYSQLQETKATSQDLLRDIVGTIIDKLYHANNVHLGGTIDYPTQITSSMNFEHELGDVYKGEITYSVSKSINRYA